MEYEKNTEAKLNEYENTIASKKRLAEGAKAWYLSKHGVPMPHPLQMIVDSSWGVASAIMVTTIDLQIKVLQLKSHVDNLEDILTNGPGLKVQPGTPPELAGVPQGEKADWTPPKQPGSEIKESHVIEAPAAISDHDLKRLSTDGRVN